MPFKSFWYMLLV